MAQSNGIDIKGLVAAPALITLAVTLLRLAGEFLELPAWLASREPGGPGALIGITWLAPIFGVYFAYRLAGAPGTFWKNLMKTLFYYGLAARIPVILVMGLAIYLGWSTHYNAFPPPLDQASRAMQFLLGAVLTQIVAWAGIWTVGSGMLTGMLTAKVLGPKAAAA